MNNYTICNDKKMVVSFSLNSNYIQKLGCSLTRV